MLKKTVQQAGDSILRAPLGFVGKLKGVRMGADKWKNDVSLIITDVLFRSISVQELFLGSSLVFNVCSGLVLDRGVGKWFWTCWLSSAKFMMSW